jgi:glycosyltransferase involved in cell wall biosynthesis
MEGLITSWVRAMGQRDDSLLVITTYKNSAEKDKKQIEDLILSIKRSTGLDSKKNIRLLHGIIPEQDLPKLYRSCDVYVSIPYGEGFGMGSLAAMSTSKPVIYTNASSLPDFCVGYPVRATPEPVTGMDHMPWYNCNQNWWRPDPYATCKAFTASRQASEEDRISLGSLARKKVESFYTYEKVGARLATVLQETYGLSSRPIIGQAQLA